MSNSPTISDAIALCNDRIRNNIAIFGEQFPFIGDGDKYVLGANDHWMTAFWTGELWLAYVTTGDEVFRKTAESHLSSFQRRLENRVHITHDAGFLFTLTARAEWQLTGNEAARQLALEAAEVLASRYNEKGRFIQAWGEVGDPKEGGRFIIDCMMNLPLLYWASEQTGNPRFAEIANAHAATNMQYIVREDGSTAHTFFMDQETGEPIGQKTHQGYSDESMWARGQAWAIYGFALAYSWSGKTAFLDTAERCADRFLADISRDYLPLWDFCLPPDAVQAKDTSASAIAALGLLRIAELIDSPTLSEHYASEARKLIDVLLQSAFDPRQEGVEGLLPDSTYHANVPEHAEQYTLFGDYYFLEALVSLSGKHIDFWGKG